MPALKLPGGTFFLIGALFLFPARDQILFSASLITEKKENLSFDMRRNCPASLFIAVYRFNRYTKEFRQFLLCFIELFSCRNEFIFVHKSSPLRTLCKNHAPIQGLAGCISMATTTNIRRINSLVLSRFAEPSLD